MNRGNLEKWAVQLYMISNRFRIPKAQKPEALRVAKIRVTMLTEKALVRYIDNHLSKLEGM